MKIPKSLNVFGTKYKIKFVDTVLFQGLCDPGAKAIFININQSKEQILATYIHEVVHAMQFSLAMDQAVSREFMEMMAENTATLILSMLKVK